MTWINFLHLYQPANSDPYVIEEATEASYQRIVAVLEKNPDLKFSLNITGCLVLRWQELGYTDLITRIKNLVQAGQIELTGSVAYHCLIPLVPEKEVKEQIKENTQILKDNFGPGLKLKGFFLPEMAYSPEAARVIKKAGFSWLILDEIAFSPDLNPFNTALIYQDVSSGLDIIFRSRGASNTYVPEVVAKNLKKEKKLKEEAALITATDGELYGLRHNDPEKRLEQVVSQKGLLTKTISQFIADSKSGGKIKLNPCNWESTPAELKAGFPYASWLQDDNVLQQQIWELAYLALDTIETYKTDSNHNWARWHLVRGLASCTFWWASARDFAYIYGPYAWNPDEVERGANELIRSIRSLDNVATKSVKLQAEAKYIKIKEFLWHKHWNSYWKSNN